ncbi:angiogenin-like isoform X2 [Polypterus senegalus]
MPFSRVMRLLSMIARVPCEMKHLLLETPVLFKMTKTQIFLLMKVLALAESLKGPFPYSADFHNCAYLNHRGSEMLQLPSLEEKIKTNGGWDGAFDSFTVHGGCMLTIWPGQEKPIEYQSGTFQIIFNVTAFVCSCTETGYEKFLRQHVDNGVRNGNYEYCAKMMKNRKMTRPVCKNVNSFIHANKNDVVAVCLENSPIQNGIRTSKNRFRVTTCKNKKGANRLPCKYKANNAYGYIKIACDNNKKPVHFEGLVPAPVPASEFMLD